MQLYDGIHPSKSPPGAFLYRWGCTQCDTVFIDFNHHDVTPQIQPKHPPFYTLSSHFQVALENFSLRKATIMFFVLGGSVQQGYPETNWQRNTNSVHHIWNVFSLYSVGSLHNSPLPYSVLKYCSFMRTVCCLFGVFSLFLCRTIIHHISNSTIYSQHKRCDSVATPL